MKRLVRLHSFLKDLIPNRSGFVELNCPRGMTVSELLSLLGLDHGEVGLVLYQKTVLKPDDIVPEDEDVILDLYPIFGGG